MAAPTTILSQGFRGLNRAVFADLLPAQYSPNCMNGRSANRLVGALGPRLGRSRAVTKTYPLLGMGIMSHAAAKWRATADTNGDWALIGINWPGLGQPADLTPLTSMHVSAITRYVQIQEFLFAFNGRNSMRAADAGGWTLAGIDKADFTPATAGAAPSGAGITGTDYVHYVVPANSKKRNIFGRIMEGIPSGPSTPLNVAGQKIIVSGIPATHADPQVDEWHIYRNRSGVLDTDYADDLQDLFYVGKVAIGVTTFDDEVADDDLDDIEYLRFNQNYPGTFKYGESYGGRMFGAGFDTLQLTGTVQVDTTVIQFSTNIPDGMKGCLFKKYAEDKEYQIISCPAANQIKLSEAFVGALAAGSCSIFRKDYEIDMSEFGDPYAWGPEGRGRRYVIAVPTHEKVTGLKYFNRMLLVFTPTAIFAVTGAGPRRDDYFITELYRGLGCVSGDAICQADNDLFFLSKRGPCVLSGGEPQLIGLGLNQDWLERLTVDQLAVATMGTDGEVVYLSVPDYRLASSTENAITFCYERPSQAWWPEDEVHPKLYIRCDGADGDLQALFYLQDKYILKPRTPQTSANTLDVVAAAVTGSITARSNTTLTDATAAFGSIDQCYVRIYDAYNNLRAVRRIISNTGTVLTWSSDATTPGGGNLTTHVIGDTYEIGPVAWTWFTRHSDFYSPDKMKRIVEMLLTFGEKNANRSVWMLDGTHGTYGTELEYAGNPMKVTCGELLRKISFQNKLVPGYMVKLWSRDGAILTCVSARAEVSDEL